MQNMDQKCSVPVSNLTTHIFEGFFEDLQILSEKSIVFCLFLFI